MCLFFGLLSLSWLWCLVEYICPVQTFHPLLPTQTYKQYKATLAHPSQSFAVVPLPLVPSNEKIRKGVLASRCHHTTPAHSSSKRPPSLQTNSNTFFLFSSSSPTYFYLAGFGPLRGAGGHSPLFCKLSFMRWKTLTILGFTSGMTRSGTAAWSLATSKWLLQRPALRILF